MKTQCLILTGLLATSRLLAVAPDIQPIPNWTINEDMILTVNVDVVDPDSDTFLYWADSSTDRVIVSFDEVNMQVHVTPFPNWNGQAEIFVGVDDLDDGARATDVESFTLTVNPLNDCPSLFSDFPDVAVGEDTRFLLTRAEIYAHVNDPDLAYEGDSLYLENLSFPAGEVAESVHGWLFSYAPDQTGGGLVSFDVTDGECSVDARFNLNFTPVNDCPIQTASFRPFSGLEDEIYLLEEATAGWIDIEGDDLLISKVESEVEGFSFTYDEVNDLLSITPPENFNGNTTAQIFVSDGECETFGVLNVALMPVNDAPILPEEQIVQMMEDEELLLTFQPVDPDGDEINILLASTNPDIQAEYLEETGELHIVTSPDWNGEGYVTLSACDTSAEPACSARDYLVQVAAVNDAPEATACNDMECGLVEDLDAFRMDMMMGVYTISLQDVDNDELELIWFANGQRVSGHVIQLVEGQTDCVAIPAPPESVYDGLLNLHLEISDGEAVLNENGQDCMLELDFLEVAEELPSHFGLGNAYPNPFNPTTTIPYSLSRAADVRLAVYDLGGGLVELLHDGAQAAGEHKLTWSASGEASGMYLVVLEAEGRREISRVTLLK
jgi:hypothetical protein